MQGDVRIGFCECPIFFAGKFFTRKLHLISKRMPLIVLQRKIHLLFLRSTPKLNLLPPIAIL